MRCPALISSSRASVSFWPELVSARFLPPLANERVPTHTLSRRVPSKGRAPTAVPFPLVSHTCDNHQCRLLAPRPMSGLSFLLPRRLHAAMGVILCNGTREDTVSTTSGQKLPEPAGALPRDHLSQRRWLLCQPPPEVEKTRVVPWPPMVWTVACLLSQKNLAHPGYGRQNSTMTCNDPPRTPSP